MVWELKFHQHKRLLFPLILFFFKKKHLHFIAFIYFTIFFIFLCTCILFVASIYSSVVCPLDLAVSVYVCVCVGMPLKCAEHFFSVPFAVL